MERNNAWHLRNLEFLRRAIRYAHDADLMNVHISLQAFLEAEFERLDERKILLAEGKISHDPHQDEEQELWFSLSEICKANSRHILTQQGGVS
jgi:hypothetical protein